MNKMSNDLKQLSIYQLIVSRLWPQLYYFGSNWSYAPLEMHASVFPNLPLRPVDRMIHHLVEGCFEMETKTNKNTIEKY